MKCAYCSVHGVSGTVHEVSGSAVGEQSIVYRGSVWILDFCRSSVDCGGESSSAGCEGDEMDVEC